MSSGPRLISRPKLEGWPLTAIALLLGSTLVLAGWSSYQKRQLSQAMFETDRMQQDGTPVTARSLFFRDLPDSSISVVDAQTGRPIARIEGEAGFARSVLRSLAKARLRRGLGPEQPFELKRTAMGGLWLADPQTGEQIDLTALGPSNASVFALYLK